MTIQDKIIEALSYGPLSVASIAERVFGNSSAKSKAKVTMAVKRLRELNEIERVNPEVTYRRLLT
jgi:hypothetical protein